jgi:hypothetical protein
MLVTALAIIGFFLIVLSLASALYALVSGKGSNKATVNRLTIRVGFAVVLLTCLLLAVYFGLITPNPYVL